MMLSYLSIVLCASTVSALGFTRFLARRSNTYRRTHIQLEASRQPLAPIPPVRTLLIDNYDSYTYNIWQLISEVNGAEPYVIYNNAFDYNWDRMLENIPPFDNIVLSPGPGSPDIHADFGLCLDAIHRSEVPVLGVCLGHQGMSHAFGGKVTRARFPMHGRLSPIQHTGAALFAGIDQNTQVVRYHSLVTSAPLPSALFSTAWTPDGEIMGLQHKERPLYGVQFHPESISTSCGRKLFENFRDMTIDFHAQTKANTKTNDQELSSLSLSLSGAARTATATTGAISTPARNNEKTGSSAAGSLSGGSVSAKELTGSKGEGTDNTSSGVAALQKKKKRREVVVVKRNLSSPSATDDNDGTTAIDDLNLHALFEHLYGDAATSFWLDSASAGPLQGRKDNSPPLSFMGGFNFLSMGDKEATGDDDQKLIVNDGGSTGGTPGTGSSSATDTADTATLSSSGSSSFAVEYLGSNRLVIRSSDGTMEETLNRNIFEYLQGLLAQEEHITEHISTITSTTATTTASTTTSTTTSTSTATTPAATATATIDEIAIGFVDQEQPTQQASPCSPLDSPATPALVTTTATTGTSAASTADKESDKNSLPFSITGALFGYLGYEARHEASKILTDSACLSGSTDSGSNSDSNSIRESCYNFTATHNPDFRSSKWEGELSHPMALLMFPSEYLVFDHSANTLFAVAFRTADDEDDQSVCDAAAASAEEAVRSLLQRVDAAVIKIQAASSITESNINKILQATTDSQPKKNIYLDNNNGDSGYSSCSVGSLNLASVKGYNDGDIVGAEPCTLYAAKTRQEYRDDISSCLQAITAGESYELCMTLQFVGKRSEGQSPLHVYHALRTHNPAPYGCYIHYDPLRHSNNSISSSDNSVESGGCNTSSSSGALTSSELTRAETAQAATPALVAAVDVVHNSIRSSVCVGSWYQPGGVTICSSSPERYLRADQDGVLESKPIKGTARRNLLDPVADLEIARELENDEKSRAENLMIVDLVRNDFGRVCEVGTVTVPYLMDVETFASVHQLVSTVRGKLRKDFSIVDAVVATFPGGSMTGAPKLRTMDIIEQLENRPRGIYSGTIGYIGLRGGADLNIVIRTAVLAGESITVGSGGAIVALSDPEKEVDEVILKAMAVARPIGYKLSFRNGHTGDE